MPTKKRKLSVRDWSLGTDLSRGEKILKPGKNIESRNMIPGLEGNIKTARQYEDIGVDWGEDDSGIDGMFIMDAFPDVLWCAVNGKIKYCDISQATLTVYEADTGLSLTAGNDVIWAEYRNCLYFANGTDNMARIAVGKLANALNTTDRSKEVDIVQSGVYQWTASGSGTNEFYLEANGGGDPGLVKPIEVTESDSIIPEGTAGSLSASEWDFGDNDSLGYDTIYVRISDGADPDSKSLGYLEAFWAQVDVGDGQGFNFNNAEDKVYIEGDEIDYSGVTSSGVGDTLDFAYNLSANHAAGAYVTQYNTLTAPSNGSLKASSLAIWRNTLFYSASDEPGIVRYGKTVGTFGNLTSGFLHNFTDGNNLASAEGGAVTALFGAGDGQGNRLYIFQAEKVFFMGIEINSSGVEVFSPVRIFTPNYGCPNQYCVISMENVVIFWTGKRCIQIRYEPNTAQLTPDESFDEDMSELFRLADDTQAVSRMHYDDVQKRLYLTFQKDNVRKTAVRDNKTGNWAYPWDLDASHYVQRGRYTYFGDPDNDKVYKLGESLSADGRDVTYRLFSGRIVGEDRKSKLFVRGRIEGKFRPGTSITFGNWINAQLFGGYRQINETTAEVYDTLEDANAVGYEVAGGGVAGGGDDPGDPKQGFVYTFTLGGRGEDIALSFSTMDNGSEWEINYAELEYVEYDMRPSTHY